MIRMVTLVDVQMEAGHRVKHLAPKVRREAIVAAAQNVLGRDGVKGFTVKNIAAEAGISPGLVIYYFGGIDQVLHAVFESVMFEARDASSGEPANLREAIQGLRRAIDGYFDPAYYSRRSLLVWLPLLEAMLLEESYRLKVLALDERYIAQFAHLIGHVVSFRGLTVDPERLARDVMSLMDGGWLRWCQTDRSDTLPEKEAAIDYLEASLGPLRTEQSPGQPMAAR